MKKYAIGNHKGGVGKTAIVFNCAARLAAAGLRVLAVDSDPQASLSHICRVPANALTLADVWGQSGDGVDPQKAIFRVAGFDLLPAASGYK